MRELNRFDKVSRRKVSIGAKMEAVGIGCFWFAYRFCGNEIDEGRDTIQHAEKIKNSLEQIENISNVKLYGSGSSTSYIFGLSFEDESESYDPIYSDLEVTFDIFMSRNLQQKYGVLSRSFDSEIFHVRLFYRDSMPVAYVHYTVSGTEDNIFEYNPSSAVVFIRKYLEERFKGHQDIQFQMLGPSPFHADMFLCDPSDEEGKRSDLESKDKTEYSGAYRTLLFYIAGSSIEKMDKFKFKYHEIIATYYLIIRWNNFSRSLRDNLIRSTGELLDKELKRDIYSRYNYWRLCGVEISSGLRNILKEKLNSASSRSFLKQISDKKIGLPCVFDGFVNDEIEKANDEVFFDRDIKDILLILEGRRKSYFGNGATIFAGLTGGVFGALIGAGFSFWLNYHNVKIERPATHPTVGYSRLPSFYVHENDFRINDNIIVSGENKTDK